MATPETLLANLEQLQEQLQETLEQQDWEQLSRLNAQVRPTVEPIMSEVEQGRLSATLVREHLEALNRFVSEANSAAAKARDEARASLQGVSQNRNAAKTYQDVSSNRQR
ncbi:SOS cell division inhibitor [Marinobacter daepoensis]|uniref:SOS cell division inhibitor n=1 Tax=Marinobacter daepoensis TaxID=262077 RepID=UPI001C9882DF|nr:SOS cell division inhibitor [Marinobacter daepoensis]MBY6031715.1 SOS cell division inhibitor [Marinobacter daepoensis]